MGIEKESDAGVSGLMDI